jgi:acetylornithine deacetylase/succinyl-diaminopimelate desuccinylase-like protein
VPEGVSDHAAENIANIKKQAMAEAAEAALTGKGRLPALCRRRPATSLSICPGAARCTTKPRIMFMTHMDTVPLCAGAKPKLAGRKIVNEAKTALGGDNRAGCGVLVTLAAELARQKLDHPPITLLFCVREESGLWGARHVKTADLGSPVMSFNYDGGSASNVTIGAVGAYRWQVEVFGRASHAGVAPERGSSSIVIFALALAAAGMKKTGAGQRSRRRSPLQIAAPISLRLDVWMARSITLRPCRAATARALTRELGKARAMVNILAAQSAEMRAKGDATIQ